MFDLAPVVFQPIAHSDISRSGTRVSEMPQDTRFILFCMDSVRGFYIGTEPRQPFRMTQAPYCQMTSTTPGSATHAIDVIGQIGGNDHVRLNNPFERMPKISLGRFPSRAAMAYSCVIQRSDQALQKGCFATHRIFPSRISEPRLAFDCRARADKMGGIPALTFFLDRRKVSQVRMDVCALGNTDIANACIPQPRVLLGDAVWARIGNSRPMPWRSGFGRTCCDLDVELLGHAGACSRQESFGSLSDVFAALASRPFQMRTIEHLDMVAVVADHAGILQPACG